MFPASYFLFPRLIFNGASEFCFSRLMFVVANYFFHRDLFLLSFPRVIINSRVRFLSLTYPADEKHVRGKVLLAHTSQEQAMKQDFYKYLMEIDVRSEEIGKLKDWMAVTSLVMWHL